jgi:murein DD-endopeptidase MepM/ murein hydrolase activator NlpD
VAVKHGSYTTIYAHLNGIRVRKGQKIQAGDVVGLVGNTGLTEGDGYMLTFEIRYNGHAQNPGPWLAPE